MLDMGTGGGEALLRIPRRATKTIADEAFAPNVPVAAAALRPHGIPVVQVEGAPDNDCLDGVHGRLPYADRAFDCVANRHESFLATEVFRILSPGGCFITQQVDRHTYDDFYVAVGLNVPDQAESWLPLALGQLRAAGFEIVVARHGEEHQAFRDIAAFIWYMRAVSWAIPGLDLTERDAALRRLHAEMNDAPLVIRQRRFLVVAMRP
jgi:SAM-dependent methyltransferase